MAGVVEAVRGVFAQLQGDHHDSTRTMDSDDTDYRQFDITASTDDFACPSVSNTRVRRSQ